MRTDAEREAAAQGVTVRTKRDTVRAAQGRAISRALQARGWTQADLARATKIPRYTISRAVRGANVLSQELIEKVAKALKIDADDIVRAAERSSLDDMPTGFMATPMVDGTIWVRVNGEVQPGAHLAMEALYNHDKPVTNPQLAKILAALGENIQPVR